MIGMWTAGRRRFLRLPVQRLAEVNVGGAWYQFYREGGRIRWFWSRRQAEACAARLNASSAVSRAQGDGNG
jgi:hypothetical protein